MSPVILYVVYMLFICCLYVSRVLSDLQLDVCVSKHDTKWFSKTPLAFANTIYL